MKRSGAAAQGAGSPAGKPALTRLLPISLALVVATLAAYSGVQHCGFVNFDDPVYVTENPHVRAGLTLREIRWAFTSNDEGNWFPLTRLSHLLDVQFFGLEALGHHWTSVVIHAITAVLLFLLLDRLTGARYRSAFVAAIFALHPLHVESVAWVSERKDVLSALFWVLTMFAYIRYVAQPRPYRYALLTATFVLGLMCKPMIVTLPFALLLLDFWPLGRVNLSDRVGLRRLFVEKLPLFALAAAGSLLTYAVQISGGAAPVDAAPLWLRIQNAVVSYVAYLAQTIWPARLAILYPFPAQIPLWETLGAIVLLVGVTILVLKARRRFPYLAVGWFWFLGTLVPVIGIIQVGVQARADRYTYIPMIGIGIMIAWGAADALAKRSPTVLAVGGGTALLLCLLATRAQVATWADGETLFRHAIAVTSENYVAHNSLCHALGAQGRLDEAAAHCQEAVKIRASYGPAHTNLGEVFLLRGRLDDAIGEFREATRLNPKEVVAFTNWGAALRYQGKLDESAVKYREALRLAPTNAVVRVGLARVLSQMERRDEALALLQETVRLSPDFAPAHAQLGVLLGMLGRPQEALAALSESIRLNPNDAPAHYNLAITLNGLSRFEEALGEFQRALAINPRDVESVVALGDSLTSLKRFDEAIATYRKALEMNPGHRRAGASLDRAVGLQQQALGIR